MGWVLSCETGFSEVSMPFCWPEDNTAPCEEWRAWDGPRAVGDLDRLYALFARLETPIDFDAIDEQPVDLICVLLAPETAGADHLKALARVSRLLRDRAICEKLRGTDSAEAIHALLTESMPSHAAELWPVMAARRGDRSQPVDPPQGLS